MKIITKEFLSFIAIILANATTSGAYFFEGDVWRRRLNGHDMNKDKHA